MRAQPIQLFKDSAAAILLALASVLFIANWTSPPDWVSPLDPVFNLTLRTLFWAVGGVAVVAALICLFADRPALSLGLLAWLGLNAMVYLIGTYFQGWHGPSGFFEGFSHSFDLPPKLASLLVSLLVAYLLAGSAASLDWLRRAEKLDAQSLKMPCPACGVHIRFDRRNVGQKIRCPKCQASLTLRQPDLLKMACFFCKEHIEFPATLSVKSSNVPTATRTSPSRSRHESEFRNWPQNGTKVPNLQSPVCARALRDNSKWVLRVSIEWNAENEAFL
jgi:hypothetical protein